MFLRLCVRWVFLAICTVMLCQCTKLTDNPSFQSGKTKLASPFTMPASAYLALAANQNGMEQQSLYIMAAGRLVYDGQWRQALQVLSHTHDLSVDLSNEKNVLLAKIDLMRENPRGAVAKLANVHALDTLSLFYQIQYHEILAQAYQSIGNSTEAITERIKLGALLPDIESKMNNARVLWLNLTALPLEELDTLAMEASKGSEMAGWMQLALISRQKQLTADGLIQKLQNWQADYPTHPARFFLPNPLSAVQAHLFNPPKQMALLLPLTGPLAGPGQAIRDGFMAAYQASNRQQQAVVKVYNTDGANIASLYEQAIQNGADYIVGPLSKADVTIVAKMAHPVPTLLLNDVELSMPANAYQFGLSPTNEARQVAAKIRKNGLSHALIIAPAGTWGNDILAAFTEQWRGSGGQIVDVLQYSNQQDLSAAIRDLLHVSESEARGKQIKQALGRNVESMPSRRQDFDVIFLLAYPTKARQIVPLLKYYFAGDVPIYSTSVVYGGNPNAMKDRDLNGVIFGDMPWIFRHPMAGKNWPEQFNSYSRLYALGLDSFALSYQLNQLLLFPAMGERDNTGILFLNANQHIARILVWGQFGQGLVHEQGH